MMTKRYMALYCGNVNEAQKATVSMEDLKPKVVAWKEWAEKHADVIVDNGAPVGKTKRVDDSGPSDSKNYIGAYVVVEAESYEAASKMFVNHPHLSFFKGNWIEIMECLPLPKI